MKKLTITFCLLLFLTGQIYSQGYNKRPMTVDDLLEMVSVSNAKISPDGKWIVYSRTTIDWDKNKRISHLWMVSTDGKEKFQFTNKAGDSSPEWSPDGRKIAFLRTADKKRQIWIIRAFGGEAVKLTNHKSSISSFAWSHDGKRIFFVASDIKSKEQEKKEKSGDDVIYVSEGPNGQTRGNWSNIWVFDLETRKEKQITKEKMVVRGSISISPDDSRILFVSRPDNGRNTGNLAEIKMVDVESGKITQITDNRAPESSVRWAPDGLQIAYLAPDDKTWKLANSKLWIMDMATKHYKMISGEFVGSVGFYVWTPDSRKIIFNGGVRTNRNLYEVDIATLKIKQLTNEIGVLSANSFSRKRNKVVYTFSDNDTPTDIWISTIPEFNPVRLTEANPQVKNFSLSRLRIVSWKSKDGLTIEGLLHLPANYQPGEKLPLILNVHGGPAGAFTNRFNGRYHIFTGLGYACLSPNVRGSSSYSDEFLRGNMSDIGFGDYYDLMSGVDYLIEQGIVDPEKLGIRGWSYGGILGGFTITQTNRFKAASLGAMVSDWSSEYGQGFNYDVKLWYIGGKPWTNPEGYKKHSSITYIQNVNTPTILFHGERDNTCTIQQSMNYFTALKEEGKTVRFLRFPREPHGIREPHHQRILYVEEIAWLQKYILGKEWKWERKEKKTEK
ncbi:hypothetical protein DRQ09_05150 [candidate division KSB1 bacterium]|nr:MAG: hypothetical protein DRQ09_05150 [candidate division KSB1 bacterium]